MDQKTLPNSFYETNKENILKIITVLTILSLLFHERGIQQRQCSEGLTAVKHQKIFFKKISNQYPKFTLTN